MLQYLLIVDSNRIGKSAAIFVVLQTDASSHADVLLTTIVVAARALGKVVGVLADPVTAGAVVGAVEVVDPDVLPRSCIEAVPGAKVRITRCISVAVGRGVGTNAIATIIRRR